MARGSNSRQGRIARSEVVASSVRLEGYSEDDDNYYSLDAERIAKEVGINAYYLRDNTLSQVALEKDKVVGALWTNISGDVFSFDIVVSKDQQGKGVGSKLVDAAIREFNEMKDAYPDLKYQVKSVNEAMTRILRRKGFVFSDPTRTNLYGDTGYMTKKEESD